jgi:hypothetical protein
MELVGHYHVSANNPATRLRPRSQQRFLNSSTCERFHTLLGAHRDKDDYRLAAKNVNTLSGGTTLFRQRSAIQRLDYQNKKAR